ncbi:peptidase C65 Otubain-domain-containing protein [Zopfochytrium polystomum]|nr:peptidase C65 Otubain-domain-containing protein [Zopfochytrium polystomum]
MKDTTTTDATTTAAAQPTAGPPAAGATADSVDDRPSDEAILAYERSLKETLLASHPLVSAPLPYALLAAEYAAADSPLFLAKIASLTADHPDGTLRAVRKDGNCFFRAFGFRLCELVVTDRLRAAPSSSQWRTAVLRRVEESRQALKSAGYDPIVTEDFFEPFDEALKAESVDALLEKFQIEYISDTIVCYLRLVTAATLKLNEDLYSAFILDKYPTLNDFIGAEVEPMNIEADHIHIVAMVNAFGVNVLVDNLDLSAGTNMNVHDFSPFEPFEGEAAAGAKEKVIELLYRPGHYDLLYRK